MAEESDSACLHCRVSGRVQGVFFRASTRDRAIQLGLSGFARNLPDGRVEVVACGDRVGLEEFRQWLWHGPSRARVENVDCEESPFESLTGFSTL